MSQTPMDALMPPIPDGLQMPFYYASLQCQWTFWETDLELARPFVQGTGLEVADFDGKAVVLLNFQRYTSSADSFLSTCNEVEFNLVVYPRNREPNVPRMPLADWLTGQDQTKTIGHLRLHVAADNQFAVKAGRELFGEPKFYDTLTYKVPSLNAAPSAHWAIKLNDPEDADAYIYDMAADLGGLAMVPVNCTAIPEFATGLGRTIWTRWTILGSFQHAMLSPADASRVTLAIGDSKHPMTADLRTLIGARPAVAVQTYDSQPVCVEPRGFYQQVLP